MDKIGLRNKIAKAIGDGHVMANDIARTVNAGYDEVVELLYEERGGWWTFNLRGIPSWATWRLTGTGKAAL